MPNYFTHLTLGAQVLAALPSSLAQRLSAERAAFDLGCLGPDPLFFYRPALPNQVRREGRAMHRQTALLPLERLRRAVDEGQAMAAGYAAGFLCHLALDSLCHPYVEAWASAGPATHLAIEAEFDRLLMTRFGGKTMTRRSHMPPVAEPSVYEAAARAYRAVTARQMEVAYRAMVRCTCLLARGYGSALGRAMARLFHRLPSPRPAHGIVPDQTPDPARVGNNRTLLLLMDAAVTEGAGCVAEFFSTPDHRPLSARFDRDFFGCAHAPGALSFA
ncbi:MAG: zinc dependent phospholipase C family protein [Clostridiales bacterium]|nr:zinc dependent phospholipase C family protein [Clostridiales bacterium]